jgi:hypothetical protein
MTTLYRKTELTPVEALIVERTLGDEARLDAQQGTLARIQQLTSERQRLFAHSAAHPLLGPANGPRIREISAEIERLWTLLRRERASRRAALERALHVIPEDDEAESEENKVVATSTALSASNTTSNSSDAA